ncbi:MAG: sigma-70 family RNA polymerase sigma factor [Saprospiraceae bacterium]
MIEVLNSANSFKKLYHETYSLMVNFAYSKTRDSELSQEIVQNVYVKLWKGRQNIEIRSSIESYLYSMVKNGIIDHIRKHKKLVELSDRSEIYNETEEENYFPEENDIEFKVNLQRAMMKMKEKRRQIFTLNKIEGLTYKEISEYLQISERVVEDNISKAMKEIKLYFNENNLL